MGWNADIPAMANQLGNDWPDIEENFQYLYDLLTVQEMWIPAGAMISPATSGAEAGVNEYATNDINIDYMAFDGAADEYAEFNIVMPPNWNRGTVKTKFYWASATGSTAGDTVTWTIAGIAVGDHDALDTAVGTAGTVTDTLLANNGTDIQVSGATGAVTIGGTPALGDLISFKVMRDISEDDMTEDAWLFGVVIQYSITNTVTGW